MYIIYFYSRAFPNIQVFRLRANQTPPECFFKCNESTWLVPGTYRDRFWP